MSTAAAFFEFRDFRFGDFLKKAKDNRFAGHAFSLGLEIRADAVAQHRDSDFLYIINGHAKAAFHRGEGLATLDQKLAGTRAGAPIDELANELRSGGVLGPRGAHQARDIFDDVLTDRDFADKVL